MATLAAARSGLKNHQKLVVIFGASLLVIVIIAGALIYKSNHKSYTANQSADLSNQAFVQGNKAKALDDAKQALAKDPNNVDTTLLVANLTHAQDPSAANHYYVQALNTFKQQYNPDASGKPPLVYWAAAGLAQQAGQTSQAIKYYQHFIQVANPADSYQQSLVKQAQDKLAGLK